MSPVGISPEPKRHASPTKSRKQSSTLRDSPRERGSCSPRNGEVEPVKTAAVAVHRKAALPGEAEGKWRKMVIVRVPRRLVESP